MDYMTKAVAEGSGPRTGNELLDYMKAYYGDPDEKTTARTELDKLVQKARVEEYVIQFQSITYKIGYSEVGFGTGIPRVPTLTVPVVRAVSYETRGIILYPRVSNSL
jgi:hypothetical protein